MSGLGSDALLMSPAADARCAGMADLLAQLDFAPERGRILLGEQRMVLLHAAAFGALRAELIESLGIVGARAVLTRTGYAAGVSDARLARTVRGRASVLDAFSVGPQLHSIEGVVRVELVRMEIDLARGHHYGEVLWFDSTEDEEHIARYGLTDSPACWMQIGYACGYTSAFMGRPILYREVECRAMGFERCRLIGKPVEEWVDAEEDLHYLGLGGAPRRVRAPRRGPRAADAALVGRAPAFNRAYRLLCEVAPTDAPVLLLGETGVGKERFAQRLHQLSRRRDGPFVAVNCAALPETLLEAELFGVERGAYTGAVSARAGRFQRAHGGTLFLDEIGSLSASAQAKLLRVLEDFEVEPLGGRAPHPVEVRLIAAGQEDLPARAADGRLRPDLYFRLDVFPVRIPPLRERREDVPLLMEYFRARAQVRYARATAGFTAAARDLLCAHPFPGNVRELRNLVERAVLRTPDGAEIAPQALGLEPPAPPVPAAATMLLDAFEAGGLTLGELEAALLRQAVARSGGNLCRAARLLGIRRAQLAYRLGKYGVEVQRGPSIR
jgi:two-component system, NtrC family, response regulator HydG